MCTITRDRKIQHAALDDEYIWIADTPHAYVKQASAHAYMLRSYAEIIKARRRGALCKRGMLWQFGLSVCLSVRPSVRHFPFFCRKVSSDFR